MGQAIDCCMEGRNRIESLFSEDEENRLGSLFATRDDEQGSRSLSRGVMPLDCVGEIVSYFSSTQDFFNVVLTSKWIHHYIMNENPGCARNITFRLINFEILDERNTLKPFVSQLRINKEFQCRKFDFLMQFPGLQSIVIDSQINFVGKVMNECFPNPEKILSINLYNNPSVETKDFTKLNKLRALRIRQCPKIDDSVFFLFDNVEELEVINCPGITGSRFGSIAKTLKVLKIGENPTDVYNKNKRRTFLKTSCFFKESEDDPDPVSVLTKLERLELICCESVDSRIFEYLPNLKHLLVERCSGLDDTVFSKMKNPQKLESVSLFGNESICCKNISLLTNLSSFRIRQSFHFTDSICEKEFFPVKTITPTTPTVFRNTPKRFKLFEVCDSWGISGAAFSNVGNSVDHMVLDCCGFGDDVFDSLKFVRVLELKYCNSLTGNMKKDEENEDVGASEDLEDMDIGERVVNEMIAISEIGKKKPKKPKIKKKKKKKKLSICSNIEEEIKMEYTDIETPIISIECRKLVLECCDNLTDEVFKHTPNLEQLRISHCAKITGELFPILQNLKVLSICGCKKIKQDEVLKFQKKRPEIEVTYEESNPFLYKEIEVSASISLIKKVTESM